MFWLYYAFACCDKHFFQGKMVHHPQKYGCHITPLRLRNGHFPLFPNWSLRRGLTVWLVYHAMPFPPISQLRPPPDRYAQHGLTYQLLGHIAWCKHCRERESRQITNSNFLQLSPLVSMCAKSKSHNNSKHSQIKFNLHVYWMSSHYMHPKDIPPTWKRFFVSWKHNFLGNNVFFRFRGPLWIVST